MPNLSEAVILALNHFCVQTAHGLKWYPVTTWHVTRQVRFDLRDFKIKDEHVRAALLQLERSGDVVRTGVGSTYIDSGWKLARV